MHSITIHYAGLELTPIIFGFVPGNIIRSMWSPQQYVSQFLCQLRRDSNDFRSQIFPSYPRYPCLTLSVPVNSRWRTETGSSYVGDGKIRHSFRACPIHRYRHRPTLENNISSKPEVETVPKPEVCT